MTLILLFEHWIIQTYVSLGRVASRSVSVSLAYYLHGTSHLFIPKHWRFDSLANGLIPAAENIVRFTRLITQQMIDKLGKDDLG